MFKGVLGVLVFGGEDVVVGAFEPIRELAVGFCWFFVVCSFGFRSVFLFREFLWRVV